MPPWLRFVSIGIVSGIAAGLFGVGGGIVVVPALNLLGRFFAAQSDRYEPRCPSAANRFGSSHRILPARSRRPAGGDVCGGRYVGGELVGAMLANQIRGPFLRLAFGVFVCALGVYLVHGACRRLGWI